MQLSSRILTALAVLILAVAVVAVRAGSPGTLEAATGTIDVVNVGTCYTTNDAAFGLGDCLDGDDDVRMVMTRLIKSVTGRRSPKSTRFTPPTRSTRRPRATLLVRF